MKYINQILSDRAFVWISTYEDQLKKIYTMCNNEELIKMQITVFN